MHIFLLRLLRIPSQVELFSVPHFLYWYRESSGEQLLHQGFECEPQNHAVRTMTRDYLLHHIPVPPFLLHPLIDWQEWFLPRTHEAVSHQLSAGTHLSVFNTEPCPLSLAPKR